MPLDSSQIVKSLCPELANSSVFDDFVAMAIELTDKGFFGKMTPYAVAYRACHLFTITGDGVGGSAALGMGQVASMSEGGLSVSFATGGSASDSSGLNTTKYGKLLLALIKSQPTMGVNTTGIRTRC